ncbi:MAG: S-adenosylmethionine decarboxylase family protein [Hyphomicrobiaceae bacterium]
MAFDDALFQLGMDLTRSSTAQKEVYNETVHVDSPTDHYEPREVPENDRFSGTHLILDLFGAEHLNDMRHVERTLKRCVEVAGATLLHCHLHRFAGNGGVAGVVVFDTGHASIRTWPDRDFVAVDLMFMARNGARRERLVKAIEKAFGPSAVESTVCKRAGDERRTSRKAKAVAAEETAEASIPEAAPRRLKHAA